MFKNELHYLIQYHLSARERFHSESNPSHKLQSYIKIWSLNSLHVSALLCHPQEFHTPNIELAKAQLITAAAFTECNIQHHETVRKLQPHTVYSTCLKFTQNCAKIFLLFRTYLETDELIGKCLYCLRRAVLYSVLASSCQQCHWNSLIEIRNDSAVVCSTTSTVRTSGHIGQSEYLDLACRLFIQGEPIECDDFWTAVLWIGFNIRNRNRIYGGSREQFHWICILFLNNYALRRLLSIFF